MTATIIKLNARTLRTECLRCKVSADYYWGKVVNPDARNDGWKVLLDQSPLNEGLALKDKEVPISTVHACFRADAGLPPLDGADNDDWDAPTPMGDPFADQDADERATWKQESQEIDDMLNEDKVADEPAPYVRGQNALTDAIRDAVGPIQIDKAEVQRIARAEIRDIVYPTQTVVIRDGETHQVPGLTHERMGRVLAALSKKNVLMVGPAGTGKSHIAKQCADALGVEFYTMSLTSQTGEAKFTGFVDARGEYHAPVVYEWASNPKGGVMCFDEIDNGNPNILGWLNALLANRFVRFENGEVIHLTPNHRVVGTGNTYGFGRTREYVGRNPIDGATKNRFVTVDIPIDEALEAALVHGEGVKADTGDKILAYVRKLRKNADRSGVNIVMSPRNSTAMAALLTTDVYDWDMAVTDAIRCGIEDKTWEKIAA